MDISKRLLRPLMSLVIVFVVMSLSCIIYFNQSFGWFHINENTGARGQQTTAVKPVANAEFTSYTYRSQSEELITSTTQISTAVENQPLLSIDVQPFDTIFRARNRYTVALIKISLTDIADGYTSGGTAYINLDKTATSGLSGNNLTGYSTSAFRYIAKTQLLFQNTVLSSIQNKNIAQSNAELGDLFSATYDYCIANQATESKSFIMSTNGGGRQELSEIELQVPYTSSDISNNSLNLILIIFYDEALASERTAVGLSTGTTAIGQVETIQNNIDSIKITLG